MAHTYNLLLSGYRGSGKDEVSKVLSGNSTIRWDVYTPDGTSSHFQDLLSKKDWIRFASADGVKKEIAAELGMTVSDVDKYKDVGPTGTSEGTTRQLLIDRAMSRRKVDDTVWIRPFLTFSEQHEGSLVCITDWRFPIEYEFVDRHSARVLTGRVYRREIPVPPEQIEHLLDSMATDMVFLPAGDKRQLESLVETFPQYEEFQYCCTI
jgi:hypothetical protein